MRRLIYIARVPADTAQNLHVIQQCEAFAAQGVEVELWAAGTIYPDDYGADENFLVRRLFNVRGFLFTLSVLVAALTTQAHVYYSHDALIIALLSVFRTKQMLVYEVHRLAGRWWHRWAARRAGTVIAVTPALRDEVARLGAKRVLVAHNGVKLARFGAVPSRIDARRALNWREDAFIVGCVGDEGANTLIAGLALAWAQAGGFQASLALIGVEDEAALRAKWQQLGLAADSFLSSGRVSVGDVPLYLSACDVCVLPLSRTEHNTFYASPLRLFEYMAARRALIASDLPAWEDVLTDGEHALLVTAGDVDELATALTRLYNDPLLRQMVAENAYERVCEGYTWDLRAQAILRRVFSKK